MPQNRKRGRPRQHDDRQSEWKKRTGFEQSEARKAYKREWIKKKRQQQKEDSQEN